MNKKKNPELEVDLRKMLFLSSREVRSLLRINDAIKAVEDAFRAHGEGKTKIAPVVTLKVEKYNGELDIKSGLIESLEVIGVKAVCGFYDNPQKYNIPSNIGIMVLISIKTGVPLAVLDGTHITAIRTGAAGAVAAKYLARKNSQSVGIIGCGAQGRMQLLGLNDIFEIKEVKVFDKIESQMEKYAEEMSSKLNLNVKAVSTPKDASKNVDILVTATQSTTPIVMSDWISEGVHINAIGADTPEKQELDPKIFKKARVVVDSIDQCRRLGDIRFAILKGIINESDIYGELGQIVCGKKSGRDNDNEITVFKATGLAIQDVATSCMVYERAIQGKLGTYLDLL